ncbi:hypothetical protein WJX84_010185, partial [Apatococcus fuscideae]
YKGVLKGRGPDRWEAQIRAWGKAVHLGTYPDQDEAARAYDKATICLGRPDDMLNFKLEDYTSEMHKLQTTNFDRLSKELVSSARAMRKSSMSCTYKGVTKRAQMRWQAQIQDAKAGSKNISLGHYASPEAAGRAYDMAAICLRGEKAMLNFSVDDYTDQFEELQATPFLELVSTLAANAVAHSREVRLTSRFKGVWLDKARQLWRTQLADRDLNVGPIYVGQYANEEDAAKAYDRAAIAFRGKANANTNYPIEYYAEELQWLETTSFNQVNANDYSFYIFGSRTYLRRSLHGVVFNVWFDRLMLFLILASCGFMAAQDPLCQSDQCCRLSMRCQVVRWADLIFAGIFSLEILVQSIARNALLGPGAYLKSWWSWVDVLATLGGWTQLLPGDTTDVSGLRVLRALRPLRDLSSLPGLMLLVKSLVESIPLLRDVMLLLLWMLAIFGIIGMQLFSGRLSGRCQDADGTTPDNLASPICDYSNHVIGSYQCPAPSTCVKGPSAPANGRLSFDNFGYAVLNVLQTMTLESWTDAQMFYFIDAVGNYAIAFFVVVVLVGGFFGLNLLVAVITAKFAQAQSSMANPVHGYKYPEHAPLYHLRVRISRLMHGENPLGSGSLAARQPWWRRWSDALSRHCIFQHLAVWRRWSRNVAGHRAFHYAVTLLIIINTIVMSMWYYGMSATYAQALQLANIALSALFAAEMLIKHMALGFYRYWRNGFNALDGAIVISSILEIILMASTQHSESSGLRAFRLIRIFRTIKLLRQFKGLHRLLSTVIKLFGGSPVYNPAQTQTWRKNFNSFWEAFYAVFEILAASNWHNMMWDGMNARGPAACLYFVVWVFVGYYVLLNLLLAILITNFQLDDEAPQDPELWKEAPGDKMDIEAANTNKVIPDEKPKSVLPLPPPSRSPRGSK